ncbi:GNAT family N-acetyltransferase [Alkalihalobacillus sp. CinArs1]|uniref:GNAT family N-acetyltransferase n=1 Tax=Alkalihalobacillus sp. CinArs1 TaxID=2995314 RepID=UPI0022DCEE1C|nr:GNAT family protein [Alkalihalobacillus sp. CinArs1]
MQPLDSDRITLRPFEMEDAPRIQQLANHKDVANIIGLPYPYRLEHAEEWIKIQPELIRSGTEYPLVMYSKDHDELIGTICIRVDKKNHRGELGYWIGRSYWGEGFATEAVKRMITFGFTDLELNKVWATAITRNKGSIKVLQHAGMVREGVLREDRIVLGTYEDAEVYGMLRSEFDRSRNC